ncbi:hypothetical protein MKS77_15765 [Acinetobacter baumannii]
MNDIEIPVITKDDGENVSLSEIEELKEQAKNNIRNLQKKISGSKLIIYVNKLINLSMIRNIGRIN